MRPIIDGLKEYIEEDNIRMHMPGHKAKALKTITDLLPELDVTEVEGVDNLHNASEIIKKSQDYASGVFKAKHTFYSVNGTTGGIYASVTSQTLPGDKVLIVRDSHKAVYQSLILGNLECDYLYPKYDKENDILIDIDKNQLEEKLKNDPSIKLVLVNYPSYYGVCSDIKAIVKTVHKYNRLLIVDEAHGSHLVFHDSLPISALEAGADLVIQSTHKTLPAFTQSSMVHVGTDRVDLERLKVSMAIYQTTSPSYILLSSIDYAVDYMDNHGYKQLDRVIKKIDEIGLYLENLSNVSIYNGRGVDTKPFDFDKTKFLFKIKGLTGTRLEEILRKDYKIQVELSDHYYCLALITALDENKDLENLKLAIEDISKDDKYTSKVNDNFKKKVLDIRTIKPKIILPPHKAFYSDKISVQLSTSANKVSGEFVIPYPPGIPILTPGEEITEEIITYIDQLRKDKIEILGVDEETKEIRVID